MMGFHRYTVDIPGPAQTIIEPALGGGHHVVTEGALKVPTFCQPTAQYPKGIDPFPLPYDAMVPKKGESVSHYNTTPRHQNGKFCTQLQQR